MTDSREVTWRAQSLRLREQLQLQRQSIAAAHARDDSVPGRYPRSATFRLLHQQPVVFWSLLRALAGARRASWLKVLIAVVVLLRSFSVLGSRGPAALTYRRPID